MYGKSYLLGISFKQVSVAVIISQFYDMVWFAIYIQSFTNSTTAAFACIVSIVNWVGKIGFAAVFWKSALNR